MFPTTSETLVIAAIDGPETMPEPKVNRLTDAEYVMPDPAYNSDLENARGLLMEITRKAVPGVFDVLADAVFTAHARRTSSANAETHFREEFTNWSRRFHIQETWLIELAHKILDHWRDAPDNRRNRTWAFTSLTQGFARPPVEFTLNCPGWEMTEESWVEYRNYVHSQLDERLAEYERESREEAESYGLLPARRTFSESNLYWFALYQFGGRSYKEIANGVVSHPKYPGGDESAVRKGIKTASQILDWRNLRGNKKKT